MDNLSHSLVGLMLARAGLDRGDKNTALLLVLAANAPDVDAYAMFGDPVTYLEVHRGYSHSLILIPLLALLPIVLIKAGEKIGATMRARGYTRAALLAALNWTGVAAKRGIVQPKLHRPFTVVRFFYLWLCCMLAVASHVLLDWTSIYGVRMMLPYSGKWMHLDLTNTIDPVILLLLVIAATVPVIVNLVGSEVGSARRQRPGRIWPWIALLGICGYEYVRYQAHGEVVAQLENHLYRGQTADVAYAFPDSFSPFTWRGLVKLQNLFLEIPVTRTDHYVLELRDPPREYQAGKSPAIDAVRKTREFQVFGIVQSSALVDALSQKGRHGCGTHRHALWHVPVSGIERTGLGGPLRHGFECPHWSARPLNAICGTNPIRTYLS